MIQHYVLVSVCLFVCLFVRTAHECQITSCATIATSIVEATESLQA